MPSPFPGMDPYLEGHLWSDNRLITPIEILSPVNKGNGFAEYQAKHQPVVPAPLDEPDPDAALDLGAALRTIYDEAAYDLSIDYDQPPKPSLAADDAAGTDAALREKDLR